MQIDKANRKKLDRYEDYPKLYIKKFFNKNRKKCNVLFYEKKTPILKPAKILPKSHEKWLSTK